MKNAGIIAIISLVVVGLLAAGASAFGFFHSQDAKSAIENNDYNGWKSAIESQLTEENFNNMVERHQNMQKRRLHDDAMRQAIDDADYAAYVTVAQDAGIQAMSQANFDIMVQVHEARQNGDFETAQELMQSFEGDFQPGFMGLGHGPSLGMEDGQMKGFGRGR